VLQATARRGSCNHPGGVRGLVCALNRLRSGLPFALALSGAAIVQLALTLPYLDRRPMHRDEALALMVARRPLGELLETVQLVRGGAPLHFLITSLIAHLDGGLVATRAFSALCGAVAVIAAGLLGRALFSAVEGAAASWALALCPVALFYGEFARMYGLFLAVSTLALWCLVRALDTWDGRWWAAFAVLLVVDVYAHPYGVVVGLIGGGAALAAILRRGERSAWRTPLLAAAGVLVGTLPLLVGYLVLASRLGNVQTPAGAPLHTPPVHDTLYQAFAHFLGVPRPDGFGPIAVYLLVAAALAVLGLVAAALADPSRGVLLALWLGLPALVLLLVQVPGTDNHVRYVIYAAPAILLLVIHGAAWLGGRLGGRGLLVAAVAAGVLIAAVGLGRGRRLADYRYRSTTPPELAAARAGDARYLRATFRRDDLFFGYDPAWGYGVISPGGNGALASARGVARSEGPLIVRSLSRLHGPIAHGWFVALAGKKPRLQAFGDDLGPGYVVRRFGPWVVVHTTAATLTKRQFVDRALRVFQAADVHLHDRQAEVTAQALRDAAPDVR
jgi:mannosyltransferase